MFSKNMVFLLLFCLSLLSGCSKWLHEDPPPNSAIELDKNKTRCLRNWSDIMDRYLLGTSNRAEIEDFWNCLDSVVLHFQKHFPGEKGIYPIDKLKTFVEDLFLDRKIPNSFAERFKDLKHAIFSGDRENFSQEDLQRLHMMLGEFKYGTSTMHPHMRIMNFSATSEEGLDAAIRDLEAVTAHWMQKISTIHQNYKLEDLILFWSELKQLLGIKVYQLTEGRWDDLLKIAKRIKSLILGAPGEEILQRDWPLLYQRGSDAYIIALLYHYRLRGKTWNGTSGVSPLKKASELVLRGLKESIRRHPDERISSEEFVELALIAKDHGWINAAQIKDSSLRSAIVNLIRKFFSDSNKLIENEVIEAVEPIETIEVKEAFLTLKGLGLVETELGRWLIVQAAINSVFTGKDAMTVTEFFGKLMTVNSQFAVKDWSAYASDLNSTLLEFRDVVGKTPYLTSFDNGRQILFSKNSDVRNMVDIKSVSNLNWMTRITRMIFHSYGNIETGVSERQFNTFYKDFREFGVDLGLLDPLSFDSGARTHLEANTFTESANGDDKVSKMELIHELQVLLSGGAGANKIIDGVSKLCRDRQQKCVRETEGGLHLSVNAVEEYLRANFPFVFANLPNMVAEYNSLNEREKKEFIAMLVRESQSSLFGTGLTVAQIRYIVGLLHFAETIVLRNDRDFDNIIDANEVRSAFAVFQSFLEEAIWRTKQEKVDPKDLLVGFAYFLKYGESIVQGGGMWGKIQTAAYYWSMERKLANNTYQLRRTEIVRAMIMFRKFAGGS